MQGHQAFSPLSMSSTHAGDDESGGVSPVDESSNNITSNSKMDEATSRRHALVRFLVVGFFALAFFIVFFLDSTEDNSRLGDAPIAGILTAAVHPRDGSVTILLNDKVWLKAGAEAFLRRDNQTLTTIDGSLVLVEVTGPTRRMDLLGAYEETSLAFAAAGRDDTQTVLMRCFVKAYASTVLLEQAFPQDLSGTSVGSIDGLVTGWPVFVAVPEEEEEGQPLRGFAHWVSWWYSSDDASESGRGLLVAPGFESPQLGAWTASTRLRGGLGGTGVLAIFDAAARDCIIVSPYLRPMDISSQTRAPGVFAWGVMGNVTAIPAGSRFSLIVQASQGGVNAAMTAWGAQLRRRSGKDPTSGRARDYTLGWLGYTTDNGMYYYYHQAPGMSYQETLEAVVRQALLDKLPIKYLQLDSWWYLHSSKNDGVKSWTAEKTVFPNGLGDLYRATGLPTQLHNRYWAPDTVYARQNGGKYEFLIDLAHNGAVPMDAAFWPDLMRSARSDGMIVYEQDWLFNELLQAGSFLLSTPGLAARWLGDMASAAEQEGVSVQYCMPYVRHLLQSVMYPAVTQARASDDYVLQPHRGRDNWRIGGQAVLIDSLGLGVSKDGFFSSSHQAGNPYGADRFEPYPRLQAAVATLSGGPVAIGDGLGYTDLGLVLQSCRADGRLLQPSRPARMLDRMFALQALSSLGGSSSSSSSSSSGGGASRPYAGAEVWLAVSEIQSATLAGILFAADVPTPLVLFPSDFPALQSVLSAQGGWAVECNSSVPLRFDDAHGLTLSAQRSLWDFSVHTIVPAQSNGWALLGEAGKWVRVSEARVRYVEVVSGPEGQGLAVGVVGQAGEKVAMEFISPGGDVVSRQCALGVSGEAVLSSLVQGCP